MGIGKAVRIFSRPAVLLVAAVVLAGCAPLAEPGQSPPESGAPTQVLGVRAAPTQTSSGQPTSSGERVSGTVQAVDAGQIALSDGKTLTLGPNTAIVRIEPATRADLKPDEYVAITAMRQPDGTLLASIVNVFAESQRGLAPGQRPMAGGNLMTNATITSVEGDTFTATFPGGDATVRLAPDVKIQRFVPAEVGDITNGTKISAFIVNGVARSITLQ